MTKELNNVKLKITNLLEKRNQLIISKQQEKIDLINKSNLDGLFSRLVYSSTETIEDLKNKLSNKTSIDQEITFLNNELLILVSKLDKLKESYLEEMEDLAKKPGKKRIFNGKFGRKAISEKYYKKYTSLYNAVNEIDELRVLVDSILHEKVETNYQINKEYVQNLDEKEKIKYYSSLAALIMCDTVLEPANVLINREVSVNKKDANTLIDCYRFYRQSCAESVKRDKKSIFIGKIRNMFKKAKSSLRSVLGLDRENGVNYALRKSVAIASLYAGIISTSLASPLNSANLNSDLKYSVRNEELNQTLLVDPNSKKFILKEFLLMTKNNEGQLKLVAPLEKQEKIAFVVSSVDEVTESIATESEYYKSEEKLEDKVEENACEIVEGVTVNSTENNEVDAIDDSQMTENTVVPVSHILIDTNADEIITTTDEVKEDELIVQSVEIAPYEKIPGLHLTFNNTTYDFSKDEIKALYCVTDHEYNGTYEDALTTVTIIVNRLEDPRYPDDLISVLSEEGQFVVWEDVLATMSRYGDDFEMKEDIYNAINDVVNRGVRNNDYVEFKASWTCDYSTTGEYKYQLSEGGNKCHNVAVSLDRTDKRNNDKKETNVSTSQKGKTLNRKL